MHEKELTKIYEELAQYEKEVSEHNDTLIKSFGETAKTDFIDLIEYCGVTDKIEFVEEPKGIFQDEDCGVFKNVHVEQWCTNMEGDSFSGFIYAQVKEKWIKVPFSC